MCDSFLFNSQLIVYALCDSLPVTVPLGSTGKWRETCDWGTEGAPANYEVGDTRAQDSYPTLVKTAEGNIKVTGPPSRC